ncbi:MAG: hypothetical protein IJ775_02980 [Muribaculaceae bacterium]|nr:hypothetical protein [Muribaculaceae bacterium]
MKRILNIMALLAVLLCCTQCDPVKKMEAQAYPINYTELMNYFVNNTVEVKKTLKLSFDTEQEFRRYFGEAAVMGRNGQPTRVNFKTQYVLAVIMPDTDRDTQVIPAEISQVGNTIVFNYRVKKGSKLGYRILPFTAVAIDKPDHDTQFEIYFKQL